MRPLKILMRILIIFLPVCAHAQSTYLPGDAKEYQLIDRLEIKNQSNTDLNFSTVKPYSRRFVVEEADYLDSLFKLNGQPAVKLTSIDQYDLQALRMNNSEWVSGQNGDSLNKKPVLNSLYKTRANLIEVNNKDFFLALNPVLQLNLGEESFNRQKTSLYSYGITARGVLAKKIGFSFYLVDNNEKGPQFFQDRVDHYNAVPGQGYYNKSSDNHIHYFDARGSVSFNFTKYINFQLGYDKNFIGNGYRSMFLSDYASSYPFVKINTRIWKINYENLFVQLQPQSIYQAQTSPMKKFMVMHHLSMNVAHWLNVGLFESEILARPEHIDFEYLNPIIFLRQVEGNIGSPDKAHAGIDFKANAAHQFQFYGQFLLDEFQLNSLLKNKGFWANKWALQGGMKYIDAFTVKNLDLQVEANVVRPFTYSHYDPYTNYSTYNQPLADPLGANFHELIGILKYRPSPKWYVNSRLIYYNQGLDSAGQNYGSNIFLNYNTRPRDNGFSIAGGNKATCLNAALNIAYEIKDNLFIESSMLYRNYKVSNASGSNKTAMISFGIRYNISKREYDY